MTAQKLRRQIDGLINLIIPREVEKRITTAREAAENESWDLEQRYSRQFALHSSMTKVRFYRRTHYKLINLVTGEK
jgi:hypothetical protein